MIQPVQKPVPNHFKGRGGWKPDVIVIHIAEGLRESVYQTFLNNPKSTHYLVNKDGSVWQFVDEADGAWGNGIVHNPTSEIVKQRYTNGSVNPNNYTISIEHEGFEKDGDMSDLMYATSSQLVKEIAARWSIPLDSVHVIRHRNITDQKSCPGPIRVEHIIDMANAQQPQPGTAKQLVLEIEERVAKLKTMLS
jgi:N-acetyl-anhydromuramyl-L-alanine amidase AmpD